MTSSHLIREIARRLHATGRTGDAADLFAVAMKVERMERTLDEIVADAAEQARLDALPPPDNVVQFPRCIGHDWMNPQGYRT